MGLTHIWIVRGSYRSEQIFSVLQVADFACIKGKWKTILNFPLDRQKVESYFQIQTRKD
jgi:hypothetical protein